MSIIPWRNSVSQTVGVEKLASIDKFLKNTRSPQMAPIDIFYTSLKEILSLANNTAYFNSHELTACNLVLSLIALTENFFRNLFNETLKICPSSQKVSCTNSINLGSAIWHNKTNLHRAAFEHFSFADMKKINSSFKSYLDIDAKSLSAILVEFDKVCELRHAIVHSDRFLAGKNALYLEVNRTDEEIRVFIGNAEFQNIASICNNLVVSSNHLVYVELCKRWAIDWRKSPSWTPANEEELFNKIWATYYSKIDAKNRTIPEKLTKKKCMKNIKKEYGLT